MTSLEPTLSKIPNQWKPPRPRFWQRQKLIPKIALAPVY